ncbi:MAG: hypothetical protein LBG71_01700, partial [Clostridiales Family XIII bacterium]|nr:hypothetical protein [Clostridiales Family XIII bacterium]
MEKNVKRGLRRFVAGLALLAFLGLAPGGIFSPEGAAAQMSLGQKTGVNVVKVANGYYHTLALDDEG